MRLAYTGYDYTSWGTSGSDGLWLGMGFGSTTMTNADIALCRFAFTGTATADKFNCYDRWSSSQGTPTQDSQDNIVTISTDKLFYTAVNNVN